MYRIGIDLGGTKIEGVVLDKNLNDIKRYRIPTQQEDGYKSILLRIQQVYESLVQEINREPHTIGVGTPGTVSPDGTMKNSSLICLNGERLYDDFTSIFGKDIAMQNDANCFAMAEAVLGSGKGKKMVFGVIMGTGCGGGIVFDGKLICGAQNIAGEWGHTTIDPNGTLCFCGKRGCVETAISGSGVENIFRKKTGLDVGFIDIVKKYRHGEEDAVVVMEQFFVDFGRALSNVINTLDPDIIVLGGGLSNVEELYNKGVDKVEEYIFNGNNPKAFIVKNAKGDSAGVYGAALIGI